MSITYLFPPEPVCHCVKHCTRPTSTMQHRLQTLRCNTGYRNCPTNMRNQGIEPWCVDYAVLGWRTALDCGLYPTGRTLSLIGIMELGGGAIGLCEAGFVTD